jgi:lipoprotein-anchoring transpeptidase ErfK/SrfK
MIQHRSSIGFIATAIIVLCASGANAKVPPAPKAAAPEPLDPAVVNNANVADPVHPGDRGSRVLRAQILLDRANFSSGEIDAYFGKNMRYAVTMYQRSRGLPETGSVEPETWQALNADTMTVLETYRIDPADFAGPFTRIPKAMAGKAKLETSGYETPLEALGEKFHASPKLLKALNPAAKFEAGESILAPNCSTGPLPTAEAVEVDGSDLRVNALDASGKIVASFPATIGSAHDPLPVGAWKILGVKRNPEFHYNPKLFWDADAKDKRATIPPGPNNPVGIVWISLSKEHYGIHGAPEPSRIGYSQSHGCIRLTNWDVSKLADMVKPGMPAILKE